MSFYDPTLWRKRAKELRSLAASNPANGRRAQFLGEQAAYCDVLAYHYERMMRGCTPLDAE